MRLVEQFSRLVVYVKAGRFLFSFKQRYIYSFLFQHPSYNNEVFLTGKKRTDGSKIIRSGR